MWLPYRLTFSVYYRFSGRCCRNVHSMGYRTC